jgi:hypothetical protein
MPTPLLVLVAAVHSADASAPGVPIKVPILRYLALGAGVAAIIAAIVIIFRNRTRNIPR